MNKSLLSHDRYDAIVVGSGIGGLTAGARIASRGLKVLLIEQHSVVGGYSTTFRRKDWVFEIGMHQFPGYQGNPIKRKLFQELKIAENIDFIPLPEFFHLVLRGHGNVLEMTMPADESLAKVELVKMFPHEKRAIFEYFDAIAAIAEEIYDSLDRKEKIPTNSPLYKMKYPLLARYQSISLAEFLDSFFSDEILKLILSIDYGFYHRDPESLCAVYHSIGQTNYFRHGGHYVRGGSQKLSDYLAGLISKNGGDVVTNHEVTKILVENNVATGVEFNHKRRVEEKYVAMGDNIIANAALPQVVNELLAPGQIKEMAEQVASCEIGPSITLVHFGFEGRLESNHHYMTCFVDIDGLNNFSFLDYGQIDSGLCRNGKTTGVAALMDESSNWEGLSERDYKLKKEKLAKKYIDFLAKEYFDFNEKLSFVDVSTPRTMKRYTKNTNGAVYGFSQIDGQSLLARAKNDCEIENLYFSSAWVNPGGGFSGVMTSAYFASGFILGDEFSK